jgi:alkaline phosphatase D
MPDPADPERIYRKFNYGNLVDLYMLDTRLEGREEQNGTLDTSSNRTILGQQQFDWLVNGLKNSTAQWNLIGQQVVMAPVNTSLTGAPNYPNEDQWDGYRGERKRLFDSISVNNITNTVVMTGDVHCAWANDLPTDSYNATTGAGSAGVEFVATSVTSPLPQNISNLGQVAENFIKAANSHVKYLNVRNKGYYILDVNTARAQADYYVVDRIDSPSVVQNHDASWFTLDGTQHLGQTTIPAVASQSLTGLQAPLDPRGIGTITNLSTTANNWESVILGTYPNPFREQLVIHYALHERTDISLQVINTLGQTMLSKTLSNIEPGAHHWYLDTSSLGKGSYYMIFKTKSKIQKRLLVKN